MCVVWGGGGGGGITGVIGRWGTGVTGLTPVPRPSSGPYLVVFIVTDGYCTCGES